MGQTDKTIVDMNRNGVGSDSVDRITRSTNDVVEYSGYAARRLRVYQTADNGSEVLASLQRTVTVTQPGGSYTVTLYTNGVLASVTRYDSLNNPLSSLNYSYDSHGRQY